MAGGGFWGAEGCVGGGGDAGRYALAGGGYVAGIGERGDTRDSTSKRQVSIGRLG